MKPNTLKYLFLIISVFVFFSCKKEPGLGGQASIKGKLYIKDYDGTFTTLRAIYPAQGENVYIIFGKESIVGDDVKTGIDGSFEFRFLRPGKYSVFAVSKDTSDKFSNKTIEVVREVEIKEKKENIKVEDLYIAD